MEDWHVRNPWIEARNCHYLFPVVQERIYKQISTFKLPGTRDHVTFASARAASHTRVICESFPRFSKYSLSSSLYHHGSFGIGKSLQNRERQEQHLTPYPKHKGWVDGGVRSTHPIPDLYFLLDQQAQVVCWSDDGTDNQKVYNSLSFP